MPSTCLCNWYQQQYPWLLYCNGLVVYCTGRDGITELGGSTLYWR